MREIEGISNIVEDTLNNRNGFNYAQFLESLLRIGYVKADSSGDQSNQAFKNTVDAMFQHPNIDIANRIESDSSLRDYYNDKVTEAFRDNEELLSAIFSEKAKCPGDSYPMLPKNEFVNLLFEAGLLVLPKQGKPDDKKGAAAKDDKNAAPPEQEVIYDKNEVLMSIMHIGTFDMDYLD